MQTSDRSRPAEEITNDASRHVGIHIFFGAPSGEDHRVELEALRAAVTITEVRFGVSINVCTGNDCPARQSLAIWVRETLDSRVDGLVEVHGRSWGCGREDAMGAERRLVRAVLVSDKATPSRMLDYDGAGRLSTVGFASTEQLRWALTDWLEAFLPDLRAAADRRLRRGLRSRPWRIASLRRWELLEFEQRQKLASTIGMACFDLSRTLQSDHAFAHLDVDDAIWLEEQMQRMESGNRDARFRASLDRLSRRELFAFQQARHVAAWSDDLATQVLDRGLQLRDQGEAMVSGTTTGGERWRLRLTAYKAWLRIYEDL